MRLRLLIILFLLLIPGIGNSGSKIAHSQVTKTVASDLTPETVTTAGTWIRRATFMGKKGARLNNVNDVYLGFNSGNNTQPIRLAPGAEVVVEVPADWEWDLGTIYVDVLTAGDGVIVIYH